MQRLGVLGSLWICTSALAGAGGWSPPKDVSFTARCDNSSQAYILLLPDGFDDHQPHDLMIALHGHGSDRWQFISNPRDECRAARDSAREHDMIYASPDYRAKTSWMGPQAEADVLQIIEELKKQYRIRRVLICGASMGGSAALTFAVLHPDLIDGVIAMNGTANHLEYEGFQEAISESFGGNKVRIPAEYKKRSAEYWPERLTMPVGLTTGGKDDLVPPQSVIRLANVLKKLDRDVLIIHQAEGGHATTYADAKAVFDFVIEKVAHQSTTRPANNP